MQAESGLAGRGKMVGLNALGAAGLDEETWRSETGRQWAVVAGGLRLFVVAVGSRPV